MRVLTVNEICERALRKIGATAIRSAGSRDAEVTETKYWLDMVVGRIAARQRSWWLVPQTAMVTLTPGVWSYDLNQLLGPQQAKDGIQAVVDVWMGASGAGGPDAYPNVPGWLPATDDTQVGPQVEPNGMIRLGHVRRQEWESIQVVDLPVSGSGSGLPSDMTPDWLWLPSPPASAPSSAPPWWNPLAAWPPVSWPPSPWPFTPSPPAPMLPAMAPSFWNPAYYWPPTPAPILPSGTGTQFGCPRFVYIDRGDRPTLQVSPCPDWNNTYTLRVLFQTYSPDFVSAQGGTRMGLLRETWNLCIVTLTAHQVGNGPVRKLPADEVRDMKVEGNELLTELEAYDADEQAGLGRVSYNNGV